MKTSIKRLLIAIALLLALGVGFFAGGAAERRETVQNRLGQGRTKLSFAIDKLERLREGEYGPEEIQSDIASDIYGAYYDFLNGENADFSGALWELWNALLFDIENLPGNEDALIKALAEQNAAQVAELAAGMRTPG